MVVSDENRTINKETVLILVIYDNTGSLLTIGGALIRGGAVNWQITVCKESRPLPGLGNSKRLSLDVRQ